MKQMAVVAALVVAGALSCATASAQPSAPEPGLPCAAPEALTKLPDRTVLACSAGAWTLFDSPYPSSDTWFSYGPGISLHGQGLRNPEIMSGAWTATPQDPAAVCTVEQAAVVSAGEVGAPQTTTGEPGKVLDFDVLPVVFSITLSGDCVWQKVG